MTKSKRKELNYTNKCVYGTLEGPEPSRPLGLGQKLKLVGSFSVDVRQRSCLCGLMVSCILYI